MTLLSNTYYFFLGDLALDIDTQYQSAVINCSFKNLSIKRFNNTEIFKYNKTSRKNAFKQMKNIRLAILISF